MKTISISIVALFVACTCAMTAKAATGNVLLGQPTFESRCELNGGALDEVNGDLACDFGDLLVSCEFAGAYAQCDWNGMQDRKVVRLIGQVTPVSLSEGANGGSTGCIPTWENGLCNPNWGIPD